MIRRRFLLAGSSAALGMLAGRQRAGATGGLDPDLGTPPPLAGAAPDASDPAIRVLLAKGADARRLGPAGPGPTFSYAGKAYRGTPSVVAAAEGSTALVATLPIDAYLYGVVPLEIGRGWPEAALQAQAIVARTYALTHRVTGRPYDLVASEGDQVWGGTAAETAPTNAAVDATEGQTVTYAGGLASVFYSAACGGHTADAAQIWGGVALPYLRGVPDPYCVAAPSYPTWSARISVGALLAALGARAAGTGTLSAVGLTEPGPDGRPGLRLTGSAGTVVIAAAELRSALGPRLVRSSMLRTLTLEGDPAQAAALLRIEGSGLGHGVGLCQWGARVMAQQGRSARDIVSFYFPGTIIHNV